VNTESQLNYRKHYLISHLTQTTKHGFSAQRPTDKRMAGSYRILKLVHLSKTKRNLPLPQIWPVMISAQFFWHSHFHTVWSKFLKNQNRPHSAVSVALCQFTNSIVGWWMMMMLELGDLEMNWLPTFKNIGFAVRCMCSFRHLVRSIATPFRKCGCLFWIFSMLKFENWKEFLDISVHRLCRDRNLYEQFRNLKTNSERIRFANSVRLTRDQLRANWHWLRRL